MASGLVSASALSVPVMMILRLEASTAVGKMILLLSGMEDSNTYEKKSQLLEASMRTLKL